VSTPALDFSAQSLSQHQESILPLVMAAGWSKEETKALVEIWGATSVQSKFDGVQRIHPIYIYYSLDIE